jgi:glycosyltransferase involved in cell wall biosynthesis
MLFTGFTGGDRVFYVSNIYYAAVLPLLRRSCMLYDCNDDPLAFPNTPPWAGGYFERVVRDADIVVSAHAGLVERLRNIGTAEVHEVPNGVDYELFEKAADGGPPDAMTGLTKPVLGYIGAIAQWFDFELVERIAGEFPSGSIALVGPVFTDLERRLDGLLARCPNVRHLGPKPYDTLGSYVVGMDVCLVPLLKTPLRRVITIPNKLYEYASVGRPIVTMKYSNEMESLADLVYLSQDADGFVRNCREAVERGADTERLKAFARENSWDTTSERIVSLIRNFRGGVMG